MKLNIALAFAFTALGSAAIADGFGTNLPSPVPPAVIIQGPPGPVGPRGPQGAPADTRKVQSYISATGAMASLQTRTPTKGQWTGALGISGTDYGTDGLAGAVRYGLTDRSDIYVSVGHSRYGGTVWGVGTTFVIGGGR